MANTIIRHPFLSNKQFWRKQKVCAMTIARIHEFNSSAADSGSASGILPYLSKQFGTTTTAKKVVRFQTWMNVFLIPTRQDYICHGLVEILWWTAEDYREFMTDARRDAAVHEEEETAVQSYSCRLTTTIRKIMSF